MLLRSFLAIACICSIFTLWAIAVSADDAKQAGIGPNPNPPTEAQSGY